MERRAQEVIDRCWAMGEDNPILLIHDVGAGGLSNAVPEAVDHSKHGAEIELRNVPNAERGMSPMGIWCNEAQERYVLIVARERAEEFAQICERENCPHAVIGQLTEEEQLVVHDDEFENRVVDMPMGMLLGKPPKMTRDVARVAAPSTELDLDSIELEDAVFRVLQFPAVADKTFLIHIGDRTVGGLCVRDQFVGPWQVPVSDVAITASGYESTTGEAMSMGERTPLASLNAPASGRMAVGEAVTNIAAAAIDDIGEIKLSANWMAAAGHPGEDANLFDTVKAVGLELCRDLGIAIPVGKDSLSMRARWEDGRHNCRILMRRATCCCSTSVKGPIVSGVPVLPRCMTSRAESRQTWIFLID
jgi:phosphoribosylformylglycinamidine synthase